MGLRRWIQEGTRTTCPRGVAGFFRSARAGCPRSFRDRRGFLAKVSFDIADSKNAGLAYSCPLVPQAALCIEPPFLRSQAVDRLVKRTEIRVAQGLLFDFVGVS